MNNRRVIAQIKQLVTPPQRDMSVPQRRTRPFARQSGDVVEPATFSIADLPCGEYAISWIDAEGDVCQFVDNMISAPPRVRN